jgi:NAD(P)-dependent dehydrogenase (short-subunit alcohol dehydrogenase family)
MGSDRWAVVTGASRGLGLEWTRQLVKADWSVVACARDPASSEGLAKLVASEGDRVVLETLDVNDAAAAGRLAVRISESIGTIDLLVNNAGVNQSASDRSRSAGPLHVLDVEALSGVVRTNAIAPVMVTQAFAPLLAGERLSVVVNTSSRLGSLGIAGSANDPYERDYGYRMSKAALNMATIALARDLAAQSTIVVSMSPGYVKTDMTQDRGDITVEESVAGQISTVAALTLDDSGKFVAHTGESISW